MDIYEDLKRLCVKLTRLYYKQSYVRHSYFKYGTLKRKMDALPKEGVGRDLFIILNGPSLKKQDLSMLKGKDLMFVNRGFLHPLYKELQPKYHVFVDPKFANGTWPLSWLDEIFGMCPNIRIILPIEWYDNPHFSSIKEDKRIFWQHRIVPFYVLGVSGRCISYGISQSFDRIFFTGFDANSCAYDLIKSSESHFYGADPELSNMTTRQHAHALYSTFLHFMDLIELSKWCVDRGVKIYNITDGGVLDMFVRRDFNDPFNEAKEIAIPEGIFLK